MAEIVSSGSGPIAGPGPTLAEASGSGGDNRTPFDDDASVERRESGGEQASAQEYDQAGASQRPQSAAQKRETKFARVKRQRAEFQAERAAFEQYRASWEAQRQAAEAAKRPKFDLGELKEFRERWKDEEKWELVEKADAKIAQLEAEQQKNAGAQNRVAVWRQAEYELSQSDPDFLKQGTRLDTRLREIMGGPDGNIYRSHERGIVAAYHRAKMELLQEDLKSLQQKYHNLEQEHQRVTGLTSISGGIPGRMGNGVFTTRDFARLSTSEMRKRLAARAANQAPWI